MSDGARTRDILDHNQVLYQLSYTHQGALHGIRHAARRVSGVNRTCYSGVLPTAGAAVGEGSTRCWAAIARSSSEVRPGGSAKTASR